MSWGAAAKIVGQIANRYRSTRYASPEQMRALEQVLATLDREALIQWVHHRLGDELQALQATFKVNAASEEPTLPEVPWRLPTIVKR